MLLKVGQLAKQICLSVRTLHHYDDIGLLSPSVRTPAGHRLYNSQDIALLHRIQALKQLGLPLQKIADIIKENPQDLPDIIAQQIRHLEQEIEQAELLKTKLQKLQRNLQESQEPDMANWLDTLALMNVYEKYLTSDEIEELNNYALAAKHELEHEWPDMVRTLQTMMEQKISPDTIEVKDFVIRWTEMLERLVGHNPHLLLKVYSMSHNEIEMQTQRGISPAMMEYLTEVLGHLHRDIIAKYLSTEQMQLLDKHRQKNRHAWPPLIAAVREQMQAGVSATSDEMRPLATQWKALFENSVTGGDPDITQKLRLAYEQEPLLSQGTGLDQTLFRFIREAMDNL